MGLSITPDIQCIRKVNMHVGKKEKKGTSEHQGSCFSQVTACVMFGLFFLLPCWISLGSPVQFLSTSQRHKWTYYVSLPVGLNVSMQGALNWCPICCMCSAVKPNTVTTLYV